MIDPTSYMPPTAKPLPVLLILDISGSMIGSKIDSLNEAVVTMIKGFAEMRRRETEITVAAITFGGSEAREHVPFTAASQIQWQPLSADGGTPMGKALRKAKEILDDKSQTPSNAYRPCVILVTDGQPTDDWEGPMDRFISEGRSAKCQRMAMAIGEDAKRYINVLQRFIGNGSDQVFYAEDADKINECLKKISATVRFFLNIGYKTGGRLPPLP